jgi:hypothetical protein
MKYFAFVMFFFGGLIVICNINITITNANNIFNKIDQHISFIPIIDTIFFFLGVRILYYEYVSFILSLGIIVSLYIIPQLLYYVIYKAAFKIICLRHKAK